MAGGGRGDGERQFLALIRDFASERSQGEKRVSDLRRRLQDLLSDFDAATAELEKAKCCKEEALRDLKGAEVEHSIANASVLAHETRIRSLQDEIAKVGDSVAALKRETGIKRDEFLGVMYEFNSKIRKIQQSITHHRDVQVFCEALSNNNGFEKKSKVMHDDILEKLKDETAHVDSQMLIVEQEYHEASIACEEIPEVLSNTETSKFLAESIIEEMKKLQELGEQISEAETIYANLGEELRKRYTCPRCGINMATIIEEGG